MGIAAWKLNFEGKDFDFQYPLLTQPPEIALDEDSMALEIRPAQPSQTAKRTRS